MKDWFSDLPEPAVQRTQRRTRDPYFAALLRNILNLRMHIRQIQLEEQQLLLRYCKHMITEEDQKKEKPREKDAERARLNFLEQLSYVRKSRKQYRALLYDAITQRNNMIEAAELREEEQKNRDLQLWSLGRHREVDFFLFFLFSMQMIAMLLFIIFFEFDLTSKSVLKLNHIAAATDTGAPLAAPYTRYVDSALMLFAGFGFLMTFVKKYSFSGLAYGFLISAFAMEWSLLWLGLFEQVAAQGPLSKEFLSIPHLQSALYGATAVAVSCGAVLGRLDPLQLAIMAVLETFFFAVNVFLSEQVFSQSTVANSFAPNNFAEVFGRLDPGGSMFVHLFGCYFGLAVAFIFRPSKPEKPEDRDDRDERTDYTSNTFAFFGTVLAFVLFPMFNASHAYAENGGPQRVAINTVLALCGSIAGAFTISHSAIYSGNQFGPIEIHHATLAGGIAIANSAIYFLPPVGALVLGWFAGVISCACFLYFTPALRRYLRIGDAAGTHSLHGFPALLGSAFAMVIIALSDSIFETFSQRHAEVPVADRLKDSVLKDFNSTISVGYTFDIKPIDLFRESGADRSAMHAATLFVTLLIALVAGCLTGLCLKLFNVFFRTTIEEEDMYADKTAFNVPSDYPEE